MLNLVSFERSTVLSQLLRLLNAFALQKHSASSRGLPALSHTEEIDVSGATDKLGESRNKLETITRTEVHP